ncbi:MAG: hypothetical protein R2712_19695 [Vicinamibacterales bacterium]
MITLHINYCGRLPRRHQRRFDRGGGRSAGLADLRSTRRHPLLPPEPNWLFSNRAHWYPQGQVTDYATANLRVTVPSEYDVVASGVQDIDSRASPGLPRTGRAGRRSTPSWSVSPCATSAC